MAGLAVGIIATFALQSIGTAAETAEDPALPAPEDFHLFLLIGQSNMSGRGKIADEDRQAHPRVWKLDVENRWVPAVDPLHFDNAKLVGVGLGATFGKTLANRNDKIHIGLIPSAKGGTRIDQWKKGGRLYETAVARTRAAMKQGTLKGILWHQGEGDTGSTEKLDAYFPKLTRLVHHLREDLEAPTAPFIAGQLSRAWGDEKPLRKEFNIRLLRQSRLQTSPNFATVLSQGISAKEDKTHFDAAGLRELGRRYAAAWEHLADPKGRPDPATAPEAIHFRGHPICQVMSILARRGGISYAVDLDVLESPLWSRPYEAEFRNVTAERALRAALTQVGLSWSENGHPGFWRIKLPKETNPAKP